ncbi:MAG: 2'-5' RNA ligase family protein [Anderseniella sp.]|jgi:2'-5' RNA ligase|nr:2'-5' RNA ligase family protein [Anderseniella sp.]
MPTESALVALIPEAESLVKPFRDSHDPSAAIGVPAHVTILYPFRSPDALNDQVLDELQELFRAVPGFVVSFTTTRRFPNVLYLAPEPAEPFQRLMELVFGRFPDAPPYGGAYAEVSPHLTIAELDDAQRLDEVDAAFRKSASGKLPIRSAVQAITLMDNSGGRWHVHTHFALGSLREGS